MLDIHVDDDGRLRIANGEPDWFGPATLLDGPGVLATIDTLDDTTAVLSLEATVALHELATDDFATASVGWTFRPGDRLPGGVPEATRAFGFQYTEFGLPTHSDDSLARWFLLPFRPNVVLPLGLVAGDGRTVLLAPVSSFHEQVIAVPRDHDADPVVTWGWHGDLERVPAGFRTDLAVIAAAGPRAAFDRLGSLLAERHGTVRPPRDHDRLGSRLSYWTDNGAAYWYRTEPGRDTPSTIVATVEDLRHRRIPVDAVQLDSWFYPHEVLRPFDTDDWVVPPTGLVRWDAREDVLPGGVGALGAALGDSPLVTHCRHLSASSPYVDEHECWIDGDRAHPTGPDLYERYLDQAQAWGVETFEHDWLIECFLGVRGLRAEPGRARAWQEGIDRAAADRGITLQWCMASPADLLQTATLRQVTSIRTSGDFAYLVGPGVLWAWFLMVNALARPLGLRPFKDVFHADPADVARHAEVEALLAALSTGPVGLGDALGVADRDLVLRTCRADGVLVRPDVPVAAVDACFHDHPAVRPVPLVGEAFSDHPAGRWAYVVAINCLDGGDPLRASIDPGRLGDGAPAGAFVRWDWRAGAVHDGGPWTADLASREWHYSVLVPTLAGGRLAVVGDPTKYATAGDRRIAGITDLGDRVRFSVLGPGERVTVVGWTPAAAPPAARAWTATSGWVGVDVAHDSDGTWRVVIDVGDEGRVDVEVRPAS